MNYCYNCGQENHDKRVTVGMLVQDLFREQWTLDNKGWRSLKMLLTKPGFLTLEFMDGKRVNYSRPLRIYLFVSFVYFLLSSIIPQVPPPSSDNENQSLNLGNHEDGVDRIATKWDSLSEASRREDVVISMYADDDSVNLDKLDPVNRFLYDRQQVLNTEIGRERLRIAMEDNFPILLFVLIPVLAFYFFLFFYRKDYFYVDSFVFALHVQTAGVLIWIIGLLISALFYFDGLIVVEWLLVLSYTFISAKRVYQFLWVGNFLRFIGVILLHTITTTIMVGLYLLSLLYFFT